MKVQFNSRLEGERIYNEGFTNGEWSWWSAYYVAKHLIHTLGLGKVKAQRELISFIKRQLPDFQISASMMKSLINNAYKYDFNDDWKPVEITRDEIDAINRYKDKNGRVILFSMLVTCKLRDHTNFYYSKLPVVKKFSGLRMAPVSMLEQYFHDFYTMGFIGEPRVIRNRKRKIADCAAPLNYYNDGNGESDVALVVGVDDMNNLGAIFPHVKMLPKLPVCEVCGGEYARRARNHNMCPDCYKEHRREQVRENVRRHREKQAAVAM